MCGIVGVISRQGTLSHYVKDNFTTMLRADSIRGEDSTGCFGVTGTGHVDSIKGDTDGYMFTRTKNYGDFYRRIDNYKIVVGHNRKATSGNITAANAHPFQEKHIIMVHNGAIRNAKDIAETEVDSHAIAHALADHDCVQALGKLDGAYAIVWYDQKDRTINLARNKERPLFLVEFPMVWCIVSEPGLAAWVNNREGRKVEKFIEVPVEKIFSFSLDNLSKGYYEVAYDAYKWRSNIVQPVQSEYWPKASEKVTNLTPPKKKLQNNLKSGDFIEFKFYDSKLELDAEVLLGNPIFGNEIDENVIVRTVLKKGEDWSKYFEGVNVDSKYAPGRWRGKIQYVRTIQGIVTIYVHDVKLVETVMDTHAVVALDKNEVETALKKTFCGRCKTKTIELADVPKAIVRKKSDGSWKVVCPECLQTSLKQAQDKKPGVTLRAKTH